MTIRHIPYGYEITEGRRSIVLKEKEVIENIFGMYINGVSLLSIADRLNNADVPYDNVRKWNKNIIKRILENRRYLGEDGYPQIITEDTFKLAENTRLSKSVTLTQREKEINEILRTMLVCGCCGKSLKKYNATKKNKPRSILRRCITENCENSAHSISGKDIEKLISTVINNAIQNYTQIKADESSIKRNHDTDIKVNFPGDISNPMIGISGVIDQIVKSAELRFEQCKEQDYGAIDQMIRRELSIHAEREDFDTKLVKTIVKSIRVYPVKTMEIELINGNIFRGGI